MSEPMTASALEAALRQAWPKVRTDPGWERRGFGWTHGQPIGVMQHHTTPPVPYPISRLNGSGDGLIKCNINTKPDGTVWLVAYRACNYSSGPGSSVVLGDVFAANPPDANAQQRHLIDNTNGNPLFWNLENDHPGQGQPLPAIQHEAIVVATNVVNDYFGLSAGNCISHAEWTARKRDPYWNGDRRAIETIRANLAGMPLSDADLTLIRDVVRDVIQEETAEAVWAPGQDAEGNYHYLINGKHPNFILRRINSDSAAALQLIRQVVRAQAEGRTLTDADIDRIIAEHAESFGLIERD